MNKITSNDIKTLLRQRYSPPSHAFFTEVRDSTGAYGSRYADAVSVALWPSAGFEIIGFEIKVSRSDFLNEMRQPEKANAVLQYCDRWYLVSPKGIAIKDELPKNWGLLEVVSGNRLYTKKVAPQLKPVGIEMGFVASLLRRATEHTVPISVLHKEREEMRESVKESMKFDLDRKDQKIDELKKKIKDFHEASGIDINSYVWGTKQIGEAVKFVLRGGLEKISLKYPKDELLRAIKEIELAEKFMEENFGD